MPDTLISTAPGPVTPIHLLRADDLEAFLASRSASLARLAELAEFKASSGQLLLAPGGDGGEDEALFGLGEGLAPDAMGLRALPTKLPPRDYRIVSAPEGFDPAAGALAWALGGYVFDRYKAKRGKPRPRLLVEGLDLGETIAVAHACALARDMVNTPANDMGPLQIETIAREIAESFGAGVTVTAGEDLRSGYPAVHAVGRAADPHRAPRMIELAWGVEGAPLVAIVGKGVVFDTGGLDIKPSSGMRLMKKDMGGAAHALALARMVMAAKLPVRLCVLVPAVENAISGDAMRPGDVTLSRKGLSIEIGNTDAEGRLILADALARAAELEPMLTVDFATLTGAARVALGPQVIPFYVDDDALADDLSAASRTVGDPLWRMPLWAGYEGALDSDVADLKNDPDGWAQAGSVTAALFLKRFAPPGDWIHFDIFAWNPKARLGHPAGAEAQAIRAVYALLKARYR